MIPTDFDTPHSKTYRFQRAAHIPMRNFSFKPKPEIPATPGWVWFLWGGIVGAILVVLSIQWP